MTADTPPREPMTPCRICGDTEPVHVHKGDERIEDYFTVGRGETDFDAAQRWKARALSWDARAAGLREALAEIVAIEDKVDAAWRDISRGLFFEQLQDLDDTRRTAIDRARALLAAPAAPTGAVTGPHVPRSRTTGKGATTGPASIDPRSLEVPPTDGTSDTSGEGPTLGNPERSGDVGPGSYPLVSGPFHAAPTGAASTPIDVERLCRIDEIRLADAIHARMCSFPTIDPEQCIHGRLRDVAAAADVIAEYDRLAAPAPETAAER